MTPRKYKYEEHELRDRHIGTYIPSSPLLGKELKDKYKLKKATYANENVWNTFVSLRDSLKLLFVDHFQLKPTPNTELADQCAQMMTDNFLLRRTRGHKLTQPAEVVMVTATPDEIDSDINLIDADEFADKEYVSENEKLRWIFENMDVGGIAPSDAPSAGTYAMLMQYRNNPAQKSDFYKTLWPKLLAKEDAEKTGKLEDTGKEIIELCETLLKALPDDPSPQTT